MQFKTTFEFTKLEMKRDFLFTTVSVVLVVGVSIATGTLKPVNVSVTFDESSAFKFNVSLSGVEWLRSGPVGIRDSGQWWANNNKDEYVLKVEKHLTETGSDLFGTFDSNM